MRHPGLWAVFLELSYADSDTQKSGQHTVFRQNEPEYCMLTALLRFDFSPKSG